MSHMNAIVLSLLVDIEKMLAYFLVVLLLMTEGPAWQGLWGVEKPLLRKVVNGSTITSKSSSGMSMANGCRNVFILWLYGRSRKMFRCTGEQRRAANHTELIITVTLTSLGKFYFTSPASTKCASPPQSS